LIGTLRKLRRRAGRFILGESGLVKRLERAERQIWANSRTISGLQFLLTVAPARVSSLHGALPRSRSQHWQDLFALSELDFKRNGYFVDFGATDGVHLSNTCLLEREHGWTGIVAEPAKCWHQALRTNRACHVETKCVWSESDMSLPFNETSTPVLSTLSAYSASDGHAKSRKHGTQYDVETISLLDLLRKFNAPATIDYLSIDTEGSEYDILSRFDFGKYRFRVITCEHNHTPMRQKLFDLLTSKGYERRHEAVSACDDWYVDTAG
jgi:FkbM family methyltransferase